MRLLLARLLRRLARGIDRLADAALPRGSSSACAAMDNLCSMSGDYGRMRSVAEGNDGGQILSAVLAAATIWAASHPDMRGWHVRAGRHAFHVEFKVRLRPLAPGEMERDVVFGPNAVETIRLVSGRPDPDSLN